MSSAKFEASSVSERLSSLMDGELDPSDVAGACAAWRDDPQSRATWHSYHLIGDVMRSDDLTSNAARDSAFLASLRSRLAQEPVVLAPSPVPAVAPSVAPVSVRAPRRLWRTSAAVAAGFVVVAGALVVTREPGGPTTTEPARQLAVAPAPVTAKSITTVSTAPAETSAEPEVLVANGKLIRDAQLDRYLAAHKQFAGSSALGVPSAFLRSATSDAANR
jgi:sigma-E factor negative regulatory protein RseA